jgi:hypothetical protein
LSARGVRGVRSVRPNVDQPAVERERTVTVEAVLILAVTCHSLRALIDLISVRQQLLIYLNVRTTGGDGDDSVYDAVNPEIHHLINRQIFHAVGLEPVNEVGTHTMNLHGD